MLCVSEGINERGRERGIKYIGAIDPAGGSGKDSLTIAVAHKDKASGHAVLDLVAELKPPFSPAIAVERFSAVFKSFGISRIIGDHWGGDFVKEPFKKLGITYDLSRKVKSEVYSSFLPLINSRKVDLLDNNRMIQQLVGLEQRVSRSGRNQVDHRPGSHDDLINSAALALVNCIERQGYISDLSWVDGGKSDADSNAQWRMDRLRGFMTYGSKGLF
jgi:hypothetical protein